MTQLAEACVASAAEVLTKCFADDPLFLWIVPDKSVHRRVHEEMVRVFLDQSGDDLLSNTEGAMLVMPPQKQFQPTVRLLWRLFLAAGFRGLWRALRFSQASAKYKPASPYYYLMSIGVVETFRGRGIGTSMMRELTEAADRDGAAIYLENTREANLHWYRSLGFRIVGEFAEPKVWCMVRDPEST